METQKIFLICMIIVLLYFYFEKYINNLNIYNEKFNNTAITSDTLPIYGSVTDLGQYGIQPWGNSANFKNPEARWIWYTSTIDTCSNNATKPGKIFYNYNNTSNLGNITLHIIVESSVTVKLNNVIVIDKITGGWKNTNYPKIQVTLINGINAFEFHVTNVDNITDNIPGTAGLIVAGYDNDSLLFSSDSSWMCDKYNDIKINQSEIAEYKIFKLGNSDMSPWNGKPFPDPTASWIWNENNTIANSNPLIFYYYFVNNTASPINAKIHVRTDDKCNLLLNGNKIIESDSWDTISSVNVVLPQCYNIFKFSCWNGGGLGGFIASVMDSNNRVLFNTDISIYGDGSTSNGWVATMKNSKISDFIYGYSNCIAYQAYPDYPDNSNIKPFTINGSGQSLIISTNNRIQFRALRCTESTQIPLTSNKINNYTLFHVSRYNGLGNKRRIINGVEKNWLSGFWNGNQDCSYQENWNTATNSGTDNSWRLYCDWAGHLRSNGSSIITTYKDGISYLPTIGINLPNAIAANETSSFDIACVYVFQTQLSFTDILNFETMLANRYGFNIPSFNDRCIQMKNKCRELLDNYINNAGGLYARYLPENMNYNGQVNKNFNVNLTNNYSQSLLDASPNRRNASCYINGNLYVINIGNTTANGNGSNTWFPVLGGNTNSSITLLTQSLPAYTLFHVARYTDQNQATRIFNGNSGNWLSGFWGQRAGVAYHEGWINIDSYFTTNWVISCDTPYNYTANITNNTTLKKANNNKTSSLLPPFGINTLGGCCVNEKSNFEFADVIIFNTILTPEQQNKIFMLLNLTYYDYTKPIVML